jgi:hypothetical protein
MKKAAVAIPSLFYLLIYANTSKFSHGHCNKPRHSRPAPIYNHERDDFHTETLAGSAKIPLGNFPLLT